MLCKGCLKGFNISDDEISLRSMTRRKLDERGGALRVVQRGRSGICYRSSPGRRWAAMHSVVLLLKGMWRRDIGTQSACRKPKPANASGSLRGVRRSREGKFTEAVNDVDWAEQS